MFNFKKSLSLLSIFSILMSVIPSVAKAQKSPGIPMPSGPVDLSETSNLVIFIIIPALILIAFLIFRKRIKRIKKEKREKLKDENEKNRSSKKE